MILRKILISVLIFSSVILTSCNREIEYSDKYSAPELVSTIRAADLNDEEYSEYDREYFEYFFSASDTPNDFQIIYSSETNDINEIGVFHASNKEEAKQLEAVISDYIKDMQKEQRAFIASYAPKELSKLDEAEVKIFGNYVIYTILKSEDKVAVFLTAENLLKS